jgi:hypothetical protein
MINHIEYHIIFHIKVGKRYDSTGVSQAKLDKKTDKKNPLCYDSCRRN